MQAVNRSINLSNTASVNQGPSDVLAPPLEQGLTIVASPPGFEFYPKGSLSSVFEGDISSFSFQQGDENGVDNNLIGTKLHNSREQYRPSSSSRQRSCTSIQAKFTIFMCRKIEVEQDLEELLWSSKDICMQPAAIKLKALDLKIG